MPEPLTPPHHAVFKPRAVHHIALAVRDLDTMAAFYQSLLQATRTTEQHTPEGARRSVWLHLEGQVILMLERTRAEPEQQKSALGWQMVAFACELGERPYLEQALAASHIQVTHRTPFSLYIEDPEGNRVAFSHYPDRS